ncbi:MAG: 30S ribosomal protein S16 [Planctomycetes bacterium GWF2_42_9]|nr:MAG: 30S ribosomal protein S16 [Planctomycetes bacterium GWF2_42_9]HAL46035.1 30S ribosomal protein S16 [Phycisphaerales bacterium]
MAVKLRLMRMGRRHKPFFRLNAIDSRTPRDGRIIEKLGHYDPLEKDTAKQLVIKKDRIEYWIKAGAIPSETVAELIAKVGIESEHYKDLQARKAKARAIAKKKGKLYDNTQKTQAKKAAEKAEAEKAAAGEQKA